MGSSWTSGGRGLILLFCLTILSDVAVLLDEGGRGLTLRFCFTILSDVAVLPYHPVGCGRGGWGLNLRVRQSLFPFGIIFTRLHDLWLGARMAHIDDSVDTFSVLMCLNSC